MIDEFKSLSQIYPSEFNEYCNLFVKYFPKKCFFTKNGYPSNFIQIKKKASDSPIPLMGKMLTESIERHLDSDLWLQKQYHKKSEYCPHNSYWLALNAPRYTNHDVIDVDAKEYLIGYFSSSNNDIYKKPVVLPDLNYVKKLRLIYDHFPGRIWCISSETLGFHIWKLEPCLNETNFLTGLTHRKLEMMGLGSTEVHPMFGRPFRRPFGQDYRTITDGSVITKWQDQVKLFRGEYRLPPFEFIVLTLVNAIARQIECWNSSKFKYDKNKNIIKKPDTELVIKNVKEIVSYCKGIIDVIPSVNLVVDQEKSIIKTASNIKLNKSENFYHECAQYAEFGLPMDDSFFLVINSLAKWLYWIEFFQLPVDERKIRIIDLLKSYVIKKSNGYVTRLLNNRVEDVFAHIERIVNSNSKISDSDCNHKFALYRNNLQNGKYHFSVRISDLISSESGSFSCKINMCPPKKKFDPYAQLPEELEEMLVKKQGKKKLAFYAKILINKILSFGGKVRLGRQWFHNNWCKSNEKNESRIKLLISFGVIKRGDSYSTGRFGKEYSIPERILNQYWPVTKQIPQ